MFSVARATRRSPLHIFYSKSSRPVWTVTATYSTRNNSTTTRPKKPTMIDSSRELYHRSPGRPFHPPMIMTQWDTHQPKKAGNTVFRSASYAISFSDHAGTHVDAPKHFPTDPDALSIDQMPLKISTPRRFVWICLMWSWALRSRLRKWRMRWLSVVR